MGERVRRLAYRGLLLALWSGAGYYLVFGGEFDAFQVRELETTRDRALTRLDSLYAVVDSLERREERLKRDPFAIERVAREEHGLIRSGERLFWFLPPAPSRGEASGPAVPE